MVFCGKPSKGCQACRERKIKCDQMPQGCSQCARVKRKCPGYRDQLDLMFRNESKDVVRKAKAKEARLKQGSTRSSTTASPAPHLIDAIEPQPGREFEIIRREDRHFPTLLPPTFSMAPTIEERATGFFFSNFVIAVHGQTLGHLDHLEDIYNAQSMDENLIASIMSVGLAGYSHFACAPQLMRYARQEYMKTLRLTNAALKSPTDAKKDSTLLAIMIMGIFEMVTGCNQRSMKAWAEHINGSAALVKLRGVEKLRTPAGRRIFIQVITGLLISCIQRRLPLPEHIMELRAEVTKSVDATDPAWLVQERMVDFVNFRSKIHSGEITDPKAILSTALKIDGALLEITYNLPPDWRYETVFTDADPNVVFNGCYHVYYDHWIAELWNGMRVMRIILNEQIREILLKGLSSKPPLFFGPEYTAQLQISINTILQLSADILASVPQRLGYVPNRSLSSFTSNAQANAGSQQTASRTSSEGSTTLRSSMIQYSSLSLPIIPASRGYFLLWPLYLAGCMEIAPESVRRWAIQNLRFIGWSMGIHQALVLAEAVEAQEDIKVWNENRRRMSTTDCPSEID